MQTPEGPGIREPLTSYNSPKGRADTEHLVRTLLLAAQMEKPCV